LAAIWFLAALGERTTLAEAVPDAGPLFDCLFVLDSGEGFFGHPRGGGVPQKSTQISGSVNTRTLIFSLCLLLPQQNF